MFDTMIKLIPLIQGYPMWLQAIVAAWIVLTGVLLALLLLTPKTGNEDRSILPSVPARRGVESKGSVEQWTSGDNSPAISNVEGDVNVTVEQQKHAK